MPPPLLLVPLSAAPPLSPLPAYPTSPHLAPAHTQDEEDRLAFQANVERIEREEARASLEGGGSPEGSAAAGLAAGPPGSRDAARKKCMGTMMRRAGRSREDYPTVKMTRAIDESNRELAAEVSPCCAHW